jgi:hypothetical protein
MEETLTGCGGAGIAVFSVGRQVRWMDKMNKVCRIRALIGAKERSDSVPSVSMEKIETTTVTRMDGLYVIRNGGYR